MVSIVELGFILPDRFRNNIEVYATISILNFVQVSIYIMKSIIFIRSHPIKYIGSIGFIALDFQNVKRVHNTVRNYLS